MIAVASFPRACLILTLLVVNLLFLGTGRGVETEGGKEPRVFPHPERICYDGHCLTIEGKDRLIYSGAFHYFRCPKELWAERFAKIKAAGFNTVETYVPWNACEPEMPTSLDDFSKVDLSLVEDWLNMAEQFGFYIIIRPAVYSCAELDNGGFPQWFTALKKPGHPRHPEAWLRTDEPVYLDWSRHWMRAVCPLLVKHLITHRPAGSPGIILFQVENEYDGSGFKDTAARERSLTAQVQQAQENGIDVPLFVCWTTEGHTAKSGPLRALFECSNVYPRWDVSKELGSTIDKLRAAQSDAPLGTTELQGGWFAQVGGKLSEQQEGVNAAQIQNLTLYAWQKGDTLTNYYMLFGGTNFDDHGSRDQVSSYDYNAPIREHGGVGERYQRVQALGALVREHGAQMTRTDPVEITVKSTNPAVEVAERRAKDGSRFLFVRTENHQSPQTGEVTVREKYGIKLSFSCDLEAFGAKLLYLAPGQTNASEGEWWPKPVPALVRPPVPYADVPLEQCRWAADELPTKWTPLLPGESLESHGLYTSHWIYYRIPVAPPTPLQLEYWAGDAVSVLAGDQRLAGAWEKSNFAGNCWDEQTGHYTLTIPPRTKDVVLLYENHGRACVGINQLGQPSWLRSVQGLASGDTLAFSAGASHGSERAQGEWLTRAESDSSLDSWSICTLGQPPHPTTPTLLLWYRATATLPALKPGIWVPWHVHLQASGSGYVYVNGHCIGRYWEAGPQHDFYVPECWLNFGGVNRVALNLRSSGPEAVLQEASFVPARDFAESR